LAPPAAGLYAEACRSLSKTLSKTDFLRLTGILLFFFFFFGVSTSSDSNPAVADAVSAAFRPETTPKVRKVESRICVALSVKPVVGEPAGALGLGRNLVRAMPPRVSFSSAPSWIFWLPTSRWSPMRLNSSTVAMM
jgi:hypothetical protein